MELYFSPFCVIMEGHYVSIHGEVVRGNSVYNYDGPMIANNTSLIIYSLLVFFKGQQNIFGLQRIMKNIKSDEKKRKRK